LIRLGFSDRCYLPAVGSASRKLMETGKGKRGNPVSPFELLRGGG